jgi:hypothetical protein
VASRPRGAAGRPAAGQCPQEDAGRPAWAGDAFAGTLHNVPTQASQELSPTHAISQSRGASRPERDKGRSSEAALDIVAATSGRAVLISGVAVMAAMAGRFFALAGGLLVALSIPALGM